MQRQWERFRWALVPLSIFALTRLVSAAFLAVGARDQATLESGPAYHAPFPTESSPGYLGVMSNWDGQWYRSIAEFGYPESLPLEDGQVAQNEWAFYPAYPMLVRALMMATRWEFGLSATVVSLTCSGLAVLLLYRMLSTYGNRFLALGAVLCLCTYPTAPILQVGYSESLALLLVVLSIVSLRARRYGWLTVAVVALSLARPIVLPIAVVIGVHWIVRWRRSRVDPFTGAERLRVGAVAVLAGVSAGFWPAIAAVSTGDSGAFTKTQSAWPVNEGAHGLLSGWVVSAAAEPTSGLAAFVVVMLAGIGLVVSRRGTRPWGLELRTWSVAYPVYLLIATQPGPSLIRFFMLAIGALWPFAGLEPTRHTGHGALRWGFLIGTAALGLIGQYYWVTEIFTISQSPELQPYP